MNGISRVYLRELQACPICCRYNLWDLILRGLLYFKTFMLHQTVQSHPWLLSQWSSRKYCCMINRRFCTTSNPSIITENDMLKSISAFAFASLPRLKDMWVYSCPKATALDVFYRACVFSLCCGTRRAEKDHHPNTWGVGFPGWWRQNISNNEWKNVNKEFFLNTCRILNLYICIFPSFISENVALESIEDLAFSDLPELIEM